MSEVDTQMLKTDADGIAAAARVLRDGGLCAFATETVYGLGADARNGTAVAKIYAAKSRPQFNPLIVHVADQEMAQRYGVFSGNAARLAAAFWPGPLTLVVPLRPDAGLSDLVTAGLNSVGLRCPAAASAQELLRRFDGPVAAPSANPSGKISPTRAEHVQAGLGGKIGAILDGGACDVGVESTIVGFDPVPTLLRAGGIPSEAIEACLGGALADPKGGQITAPGQLNSHYAPNASVRLNVPSPAPGEIYIGFGPTKDADFNLSAAGDLIEAAANLFQILHQANETHAPIAIAPIPDFGLGAAINDRLKRAAAPRD